MIGQHHNIMIQLNREAVYYIKEQRNADAYKMLNQGLGAMLDSLKQQQQEQQQQQHHRYRRQHPVSYAQQQSPSQGMHSPKQPQHAAAAAAAVSASVVSPVQLPCTTLHSDMQYSPDNYFQLYDSAFLISSEAAPKAPSVGAAHQTSDTSTSVSHFNDLIVATMSYNMGLLFHRQGVLKGDCKMLGQALNMYRAAASVVQKEENIEDGLFAMALANNMGHIYSHFYRIKEARHYRHILEELIDDELVSIDNVQDAPEIYFFVQSLQFREFVLTGAPAA